MGSSYGRASANYSSARKPKHAGGMGMHGVEALENARLVGFGDADAGIRDGKYDFAIARLRTDDNFATRKRVLQGVVEQILQNLGETAAVAGNVRHAVERLHGNGDLLFRGAVPGGFDARFD